MTSPSSLATRLPRAVDRARWIVVTMACGLVTLFAGPSSHLASISSLVHLSAGESGPAAGFVVTGRAEKLLLVRGVGPGLRQFGMDDTLPDPVLSLHDGSGREIRRNANWSREPNAEELRNLSAELGAFPLPPDGDDAVLAVFLPAGNYTLTVNSASKQGGVALIEVYEAGGDGRLANVATLAGLTAAHPAFFGTFRVTGDTPKKFLIRAVGPTLGAMGVGDALADPQLAIYNYAGAGTAARNDDWCEPIANDHDDAEITAATVACGAFPLAADGKDAAVLVTLKPGAYTAQVTGKGADAGRVLLEIYVVP